MSDASIFQIEEGEFALSLVDKNEAGYSDSWQAPGGADVLSVTVADYTDAVGSAWVCQVTSGALTPEPSTNTSDVPATFCSPARVTPTPGETGYTLDASFLQDPHIKAGLSRYLFENDTMEAYFLLGLNGGTPPRAIGRVRVQAGAIGGEARTTLTTDISLPLSRKPQIAFGTTDAEAVPPTSGGGGPVAATGATAGTPGTFTPAGSTPPADLAGMSAITASPATAWTVGQYVSPADSSQAHWDGAAWVVGAAP